MVKLEIGVYEFLKMMMMKICYCMVYCCRVCVYGGQTKPEANNVFPLRVNSFIFFFFCSSWKHNRENTNWKKKKRIIENNKYGILTSFYTGVELRVILYTWISFDKFVDIYSIGNIWGNNSVLNVWPRYSLNIYETEN